MVNVSDTEVVVRICLSNSQIQHSQVESCVWQLLLLGTTSTEENIHRSCGKFKPVQKSNRNYMVCRKFEEI